jgi:hypothetical protein
VRISNRLVQQSLAHAEMALPGLPPLSTHWNILSLVKCGNFGFYRPTVMHYRRRVPSPPLQRFARRAARHPFLLPPRAYLVGIGLVSLASCADSDDFSASSQSETNSTAATANPDTSSLPQDSQSDRSDSTQTDISTGIGTEQETGSHSTNQSTNHSSGTDEQIDAIRGQRIQTYVHDRGATTQPATDSIGLYFRWASGEQSLTSAVPDANGAFIFAQGLLNRFFTYWPDTIWRFRAFKNVSDINLNDTILGRPERQLIAQPSALRFKLHLANSPSTSDGLAIVLRSAGARFYGHATLAKDLPLREGFELVGIGQAGEGRIDADRGDRLHIVLSKQHVLPDQTRCEIPIHRASVDDVRIVEGVSNSIHAELVPLAGSTRWVTLPTQQVQALVHAIDAEAILEPSVATTSLGLADRFSVSQPYTHCFAPEVLPFPFRALIPQGDEDPSFARRYLSYDFPIRSTLRKRDGSGVVHHSNLHLDGLYAWIPQNGMLEPNIVYATDLRAVASDDVSPTYPFGTRPRLEWNSFATNEPLTFEVRIFRLDGAQVVLTHSFETQDTSLELPDSWIPPGDFVAQVFTTNRTRLHDGSFPPEDRFYFVAPSAPWFSGEHESDDDDDTSQSSTDSADTTDTTESSSADTSSDSQTSSSTGSTDEILPETLQGKALVHSIGDDGLRVHTIPAFNVLGFGTPIETPLITPMTSGDFSVNLNAPTPWLAHLSDPAAGVAVPLTRNFLDLTHRSPGRFDRARLKKISRLSVTGLGMRDFIAGDNATLYSFGADFYAGGTLKAGTNFNASVDFDPNFDSTLKGLISTKAGDRGWVSVHNSYVNAMSMHCSIPVAGGVIDTLEQSADSNHVMFATVNMATPEIGTRYFQAKSADLWATVMSGNDRPSLVGMHVSAWTAPVDPSVTGTAYSYGYCNSYPSDIHQELLSIPLVAGTTMPSTWYRRILVEADARLTLTSGSTTFVVRPQAGIYLDIPPANSTTNVLFPYRAVTNIRVDNDPLQQRSALLRWDAPAGEAPVLYSVTRNTGTGTSSPHKVYITQDRVMPIFWDDVLIPAESVVYVVTAYYGNATPGQPLLPTQVRGYVSEVSPIFGRNARNQIVAAESSAQTCADYPPLQRSAIHRALQTQAELFVSRAPTERLP